MAEAASPYLPADREFLVRLRKVGVRIGDRPVLENVNWTLAPGQVHVLMGDNGSGKTSFIRLVAGQLWPMPGQGTREYDFGSGTIHHAVGAGSISPALSRTHRATCAAPHPNSMLQ